MLADEHFKVLFYEEDGNKVFPSLSTPLRGGVAITMHDTNKRFGAIHAFTKHSEINSIMQKVVNGKTFASLMDIVYSRTSYRLTDKMHKDHPSALRQLSEGHPFDMSSNIFQRLPDIFYDKAPADGQKYVQILGRDGNRRIYKYVRSDYIKTPDNFKKFKVFLAQANGSGEFGEVLSPPVIAPPRVGATETFISIGKFNTATQAQALEQYLKTKFARALLNVLKVTQNGNKPVWRYVPLQDFTPSSDIDWSEPVAGIDRQLYAKYGLTAEEIAFVETHVREME